MADKEGEGYQVLQFLLLQQACIDLFLQPLLIVCMGLQPTPYTTLSALLVCHAGLVIHAVDDMQSRVNRHRCSMRSGY